MRCNGRHNNEVLNSVPWHHTSHRSEHHCCWLVHIYYSKEDVLLSLAEVGLTFHCMLPKFKQKDRFKFSVVSFYRMYVDRFHNPFFCEKRRVSMDPLRQPRLLLKWCRVNWVNKSIYLQWAFRVVPNNYMYATGYHFDHAGESCSNSTMKNRDTWHIYMYMVNVNGT